MTTKFLFKIASLSLLAFVFSCKQASFKEANSVSKKEQIASIDLEKIIERGFITAIMDNSSTGLFIYKGKTMGYEYELLKRYCETIGVDLRIIVTQNLEEAFNKLNAGEGDIMAYNLTITKERKKRISFTYFHDQQHLVLIQRKPNNWRQQKKHEIEARLIRNPIELIGKEVVVRPHSSYQGRLVNLSEEIGGDIIIVPGGSNEETEELIRQVANKKIDFTVAENNIASVNATYYQNLDVKTAISFPQQIAWGVRKNSSKLLNSLNRWILTIRKSADYNMIYDKYFKSPKAYVARNKGKFSNEIDTFISPYDQLIKQTGEELGWDWRLLAAMIYKESRFDPFAESWVGAKGLMQVMPNTANEYGVNDLEDPAANMYAGKKHLQWLQAVWKSDITDPHERVKFVLASYNVGRGHVLDAIRLTRKYGRNTQSWSEVSEFLIKKSSAKYFNDPVVEYGYCRGTEPVQYVKDILETYFTYKVLIKDEMQLAMIVLE